MVEVPGVNQSADRMEPILIAGPTAVGKSDVAMRLAAEFNGEIITVDSMQVYKGLDIGTAKPSIADRERVPHHLVDIRNLSQGFDAAQFVEEAIKAVREISQRGRLPILCGGTGLYFNAYLYGLGTAPKADPTLRAQLEAMPLEDLLTELEQGDPVAYQSIDRNNRRRVVRAVEVLRLTGQPLSARQADWQQNPAASHAPARFFALSRSVEDLRRRIDVRVDEMFRRGLVEETRQLLSQGFSTNRTAMQALGYRQVMEFLQGIRSLPETVELVKIRTRQFAKRQMTWFRRQAEPRWIRMESGTSAESVATLIARDAGLTPQGT